MRYNRRDERIKIMNKVVEVCVKDVAGKKKILFIVEYGKNREISDSSLLYLCVKEEAVQEVDEIIYDLHKRGQDEFVNYKWGYYF